MCLSQKELPELAFSSSVLSVCYYSVNRTAGCSRLVLRGKWSRQEIMHGPWRLDQTRGECKREKQGARDDVEIMRLIFAIE